MIDVMDWIGWDKILFASDYPHWDFDDPFLALPPSLSEERRSMIYSGNAKALYRFVDGRHVSMWSPRSAKFHPVRASLWR